MTGADVVAEARTWLGCPYVHQASLKGIATDCIGLIAGVAERIGVPEARAWAQDVRRKGYSRQPDAEMLLTAASEYLTPIPNAVPGDVLLLRFTREPQHFAIFTGATIIHAYASAQKVVENDLTRSWRCRIVAAYRFKGL